MVLAGEKTNIYRGVSQYLAKAIHMVFCAHVDGDVVNGMAAQQADMPPYH